MLSSRTPVLLQKLTPITAELIADLAGLNVVPTIAKVTTFVEDTTRPELRGFNLNVNDSTLTLSFSEAIELGSLNIIEILLRIRQTSAQKRDYP